MWIFTNRGFFSIVADKTNPENLLVRARFKGDIEAVFKGDVKVEVTPGKDYRFRTSLPVAYVALVIANEIKSIDYPNFKNSVRAKRLRNACTQVWNVMFRAQETARPKKRRGQHPVMWPDELWLQDRY